MDPHIERSVLYLPLSEQETLRLLRNQSCVYRSLAIYGASDPVRLTFSPSPLLPDKSPKTPQLITSNVDRFTVEDNEGERHRPLNFLVDNSIFSLSLNGSAQPLKNDDRVINRLRETRLLALFHTHRVSLYWQCEQQCVVHLYNIRMFPKFLAFIY